MSSTATRSYSIYLVTIPGTLSAEFVRRLLRASLVCCVLPGSAPATLSVLRHLTRLVVTLNDREKIGRRKRCVCSQPSLTYLTVLLILEDPSFMAEQSHVKKKMESSRNGASNNRRNLCCRGKQCCVAVKSQETAGRTTHSLIISFPSEGLMQGCELSN